MFKWYRRRLVARNGLKIFKKSTLTPCIQTRAHWTYFKNFENFMAPFMDSVHLSSRAIMSRQVTFCHSVPRSYWYSNDRLCKDERLSRPWSHPVILNPGPLDWESRALIIMPYPANIYLFKFNNRNSRKMC